MARAQCAWFVAFFLVASMAEAVNIQLVPVGNPGNPGELSGGGVDMGPARITGGVSYPYQIAVHEVSVNDYVEFLNAVAKNDPHGLYNSQMEFGQFACGITARGGGPFVYSGSSGHGVNYVSFFDAMRFVNWLENGQPSGAEGPDTTETGSYNIAGGAVRNPGAHWVIPTEDEWYKAAFHKNDGPTDHYWDYPASDSPNFLGAASPYGAFMGDALDEWNETINDLGTGLEYRGIRGGSQFHDQLYLLSASSRFFSSAAHYPFPSSEGYELGFRVAYIGELSVPEPNAALLLILVLQFAYRRRRVLSG